MKVSCRRDLALTVVVVIIDPRNLNQVSLDKIRSVIAAILLVLLFLLLLLLFLLLMMMMLLSLLG